MTKLLVSVRDVAEARTALDAGVDLLDLKEPTHGPLGAVDTATSAAIVDLVAGRAPVSIALGELINLIDHRDPSLEVSRGAGYVKLGLTRCAARSGWVDDWRNLLQAIAPHASAVAVVYADGASVAAPGGDEILEAATLVGCRAILVDTAIKDGRGLLDHWPLDALRRFLAEARRRELTTVVGGGLTLDTIPTVARCEPDYVAVRGAACRGERTDTVDAMRIAAVREALTGVHPRRLAGG